MTSVAVLIPVLGRPHRVGPLLESLAGDRRCRPYFVCSPDDDAEIEAIAAVESPPAVAFTASWPAGPGDYARKMNLAFRLTDEPYAFLGADDLRFHPGWLDAALEVQALTDACVVGTNDLGNARVRSGKHSTHSLVHRGYAEWGTVDDRTRLLHEGYDHQFVDDEFVETAKARDVFAQAPRSYVEHLHPNWGKAPTDGTYAKAQRAFQEDHALYVSRRHLWAGSQRG